MKMEPRYEGIDFLTKFAWIYISQLSRKRIRAAMIMSLLNFTETVRVIRELEYILYDTSDSPLSGSI